MGRRWLSILFMSKEHASAVFTNGRDATNQYGTDAWRSEYAAAIGAPCGAMESAQGVYARPEAVWMLSSDSDSSVG